MRLEVIVPDSARPDLKVKATDLVRRLNEDIEFVNELLISDSDAIDRFFTPERLAIIDAAEAEALRGDVYTLDQVDKLIQQKHDEWLEKHPH